MSTVKEHSSCLPNYVDNYGRI